MWKEVEEVLENFLRASMIGSSANNSIDLTSDNWEVTYIVTAVDPSPSFILSKMRRVFLIN